MGTANLKSHIQDSGDGPVESSTYPLQNGKMSMFSEYWDRDWISESRGYEWFVADLETDTGETRFGVKLVRDSIAILK